MKENSRDLWVTPFKGDKLAKMFKTVILCQKIKKDNVISACKKMTAPLVSLCIFSLLLKPFCVMMEVINEMDVQIQCSLTMNAPDCTLNVHTIYHGSSSLQKSTPGFLNIWPVMGRIISITNTSSVSYMTQRRLKPHHWLQLSTVLLHQLRNLSVTAKKIKCPQNMMHFSLFVNIMGRERAKYCRSSLGKRFIYYF